MTNEQAKSELMQIYMSLSEEKKKALDVAFKAMEQAIPEMYYPQVDGITPTVVAQADGEKTCGTCRNEDTYHCAECENKSDYEQSQADGEYISRQAVMDCYKKWQPYMATKLHEFEKELSELPSVAIPSAEPKKCKDCKWWRDSDGAYRRGVKAESRCPINTVSVANGWGYCYMFEPQESEDKDADSN